MNKFIKSKRSAIIVLLFILCVSTLWVKSSGGNFTLFAKMFEEQFYRETFVDYEGRGHIYQKFYRSKLIVTSVDTDRDGRRDAIYKHIYTEKPTDPAFEITHFKEDRDHDGVFEVEGMSKGSEIILVAADIDSGGQMDHFFYWFKSAKFLPGYLP